MVKWEVMHAFSGQVNLETVYQISL